MGLNWFCHFVWTSEKVKVVCFFPSDLLSSVQFWLSVYPHLLQQHGGEGVERLGEGQDDGAVEEGQELWRSASNFGEDDDQDPGFVDGDYDLFHDVDVEVERGGALMVDVQP